jgi:hypothetical protein
MVSCMGWINVTDKRPELYRYIAEFSGKPNIVLDHDRLQDLEYINTNEGIENAKRRIGESKYLGLTWDKLN